MTTKKTKHVLQNGRALCGDARVTLGSWPQDHSWVGIRDIKTAALPSEDERCLKCFEAAETTLPSGAAVAVRGQGRYPTWVPAYVKHRSDQHHRGGVPPTEGYYVSYPLAVEQWHCEGGWVPRHSLMVLCRPMSLNESTARIAVEQFKMMVKQATR